MTATNLSKPAGSKNTGAAPALEISDLAVDFVSGTSTARALDGVDLTIRSGTSVAIVGESGSGKSTLAALIGRLHPRSARIATGGIAVHGTDVLGLDVTALRALRRDALGYVPQDPIGSLNPTLRVGRQLALVLRSTSDDAGPGRQTELLTDMQIDDPARVLRMFPHQLSGGMAQRIAIAIAMCRNPRLLIADEPTAALDSQVREEVIRLLFDRARAAGTTIMWLSHDLPAVSRWCDEIAVMYAGRVVETGPARAVLAEPAHPYSRALARTDPSRMPEGQRLATIAGTPPVLHGPADGCAFADRCPLVIDRCRTTRPTPVAVPGGRRSLCLRTDEILAGTIENPGVIDGSAGDPTATDPAAQHQGVSR